MRYPPKNFRYLGPSMCFSKRINWIISEVQRQNFFLKVFSSSNKVLAALGSGIGTCSVFLHSFPFLGNVVKIYMDSKEITSRVKLSNRDIKCIDSWSIYIFSLQIANADNADDVKEQDLSKFLVNHEEPIFCQYCIHLFCCTGWKCWIQILSFREEDLWRARSLRRSSMDLQFSSHFQMLQMNPHQHIHQWHNRQQSNDYCEDIEFKIAYL